jgi:hypothetical protein
MIQLAEHADISVLKYLFILRPACRTLSGVADFFSVVDYL